MQMALSAAMASVQRCRRPRSLPTPKALVVRSESAPAMGVASTEATAPSPDTRPRESSLVLLSMSCSCIGSRT